MIAKTVVYKHPPENFVAQVQVAACCLECMGKYLFLRRSKAPTYSYNWGVPGGKLEEGETAKTAVVRELYEETAIQVLEDEIQYLRTYYIRRPVVDFAFHMFYRRLDILPDVALSSEHDSFRWLTKVEASKLPMFPGSRELMNFMWREGHA